MSNLVDIWLAGSSLTYVVNWIFYPDEGINVGSDKLTVLIFGSLLWFVYWPARFIGFCYDLTQQ